MKNKRIISNIFTTGSYYIWLLFLCTIIVSIYDIKAGFALGLVTIVCFVMNLSGGFVYRKGVKKFLNILTNDLQDNIGEVLGGRLIPLAIIRHDGVILWTNDGFNEIANTQFAIKAHITEVIPNFDLCECLNVTPGTFYKIEHLGRNYLIDISSSQTDDEKYYALHFKDSTEYDVLKEKYNNEKFVSAIIIVDNYDDVMMDISNSAKPKVVAAIEETLDLWAQSVNGILKKYEKDRFMFYFSKQDLDMFINKKFDVLEKTREIYFGNRISPTLSIGVGHGGENMLQNETYAYSALDMALGRGGDQAIVKNGENYLFFGGKSQETEKRTKVKARVVAEAIKQLLIENDEIIIMGHKHADCDSFGAALGLCSAVRAHGKACKIVMENYNSTVAKMLETFHEGEYEDLIINKAYANEIISKNTLVFVVDTHIKSMVEEPSLLEVSKNIIVIDHHRKNADFIQNPLISYHEPYASSASELVTEIIQYMGDNVHVNKSEAEALFAGIYLDTKNFTIKTGVRTFEAASFLKKLGVDTISVKKLFQIDFNSFTKKWKILENIQRYKQSVLIAKCTRTDADMQTIVAKAADELLDVADVTCSFVICDMNGRIFISARSFGAYNIQIIMEKLGGGGHLTSAATVLNNVDIDEAEAMLKKAIDEYLEEN